MFILTPEEVSALRESIRREKEVLGENISFVNTDSLTYKASILRNSYYLKARNLECIDIGTKFTYHLFEDGQEYDAMLTSKEIEGLDSKDTFIGKESELGQLLIGKKSGDFIEQVSENGNSCVIGRVSNIQTDSSEYVHFICEKVKNCRSSKYEIRKRKELNIARKTDSVAQEEWEMRHMLTESQVKLLNEEVTRLGNGELDSLKKQRISYIRKLLKESKVAPPPEGDTIGIGTVFSVTIETENGLQTKRVEIVPTAVTSETDDEFMELISPIGSRVFGLKEGEEFEYRSPKIGMVRGVVFDIDNIQKSLKTNNALAYHNRNMKTGVLVEGQVEMLQAELEYRRKILEARTQERKRTGYDFMNNSEVTKLESRIHEICELLTERRVVGNPNSDIIDIGSEFLLNLHFPNGENEVLGATLVEEFVSHEASSGDFVPMDKEIGQAIYGKGQGEAFSYLLSTGMKVDGEILEVVKTNMDHQALVKKGK